MSSIQYSLPIATNKVLDAVESKTQEVTDNVLSSIDAFRRSQDVYLDYFIEPVTTTDDTLAYMVHIKYINGIIIHSYLYENVIKDGQTTAVMVTGDTLEKAVLSKGKLYAWRNLWPYYVSVFNTYIENGKVSIHIRNQNSDKIYLVQLNATYINPHTATIIGHTYNNTSQTMTKDFDVTTDDYNFISQAHIEFTAPIGSTNGNGSGNYFIEIKHWPTKESETQACFSIVQ